MDAVCSGFTFIHAVGYYLYPEPSDLDNDFIVLIRGSKKNPKIV